MDELLQELHLENYKNSKLTLKKVLCISKEDSERSAWKTIPSWRFLKKLIALDGTARNTRQDEFEEEPIVGFSSEGNLLEMFEESSRTFSHSVHPLDVVCAIMNCSDSFLQQEIVTKMSMCQFAVPLLLPSGDGFDCTFMLWAMRNIIKRWRPPWLLGIKGFKEENIANISMPIFSFVRIGNCCLSKSRVLNKILSPTHTYHDFFVHQDMECGYRPRTISEGLLEMSWYFPGGNENSNVFQEPIAVTNLRGDLITNQKQLKFLTNMSSAVFVFAEDIQEEHWNFLKSCSQGNPSYFFIICPQKGREKTKQNLRSLSALLNGRMNNILVKGSSMNEAEIVKQIQAIMRNITKTSSDSSDFKHLAGLEKDASRFEIGVDESSGECQRAKERALKICRKIQKVPQYKKETMILQRDLWSQITKNEKELCRMREQDDVDVEDYKSKLISQNVDLRNQQRQQGLQGDIKTFQKDLIQLSSTEKLFFLKWMKFLLDDIARSNLSELHDQYLKYSTNMAELKRIDRHITDSSLGIENFLRELGQMYEAQFFDKNHSDLKANYGDLPGIAADLLLEGFALELIDGDTSSIPVKWITNVLNQLDAKTGKRCTMRVITVVGVQSTGKSTLLNTMFGLQFPVASGRCTRGAFMTLLMVEENFHKELGCDFVLVIDTEGLRAPEWSSLEDSHEHDNELATLVVGLSDITLVNLAMENTSEMKDILQVVVHAFLRMKEIGKKPNCHFIHQNVSDVSAHIMNIRHRKTLLEHLNGMTKAAAKMEKLEGITSFNDIMDYDLNDHTWYIPGLWYGAPPMAPISNGYSEGILSLKEYLLQFMKKMKKPQNIPNFLKWLQSLWTAVKHEKFIFSFRNSLVADAYDQLSVKYSQLEWSFRSDMYVAMTESLNSIKNQQRSEMMEEVMVTIQTSMPEKLKELKREKQESLMSFFQSEMEHGHLVEKYLEDFSKSLDVLSGELKEEWTAKLWETLGIQKMKCKIQDLKDGYSTRIEAKVNSLLDLLKEREGTICEDELESQFEAMWEDTTKGFQIRRLKNKDVDQQMLQQLRKEMKNKSGVINQQLLNIGKLSDFEQASFVLRDEHIDLLWYKRSEQEIWHKVANFKNFYKDDCCYKTKNIAEDVMNRCVHYIKEKVVTEDDYHDTFCQELLTMVNERLRQGDVQKLHTTDQFDLDLKLLVLGKASKAFQKMHDTFVDRNDASLCLKAAKSEYLSIFKNVFQNKDECKNRAKQFCQQCLLPAMVKYVKDHLGKEIVNDLLNGEDSMKYMSRTFFQLHVLRKLIEDGEFEQYVKYINDYKNFVKNVILESILQKYAGPGCMESLASNIVRSMMTKVRKTLQDGQLLERSMDVSSFLSNIQKELERDLVISQDNVKLIIFQNSASVTQFSADVNDFLSKAEADIVTEIGSLSVKSLLRQVTLKPEDELFNKVIGCGEQCPFCKVPCEAGCSEHTQHFATIHRPQGLGRYRFISSNVLCSALCSTDVVTERRFQNSDTDWKLHPYKEYQTFYPDWKIQPDPSISASDYWKFIFKEFNKQFAQEYRAKPANLPDEWYDISKEQAIESLKESFCMKED